MCWLNLIGKDLFGLSWTGIWAHLGSFDSFETPILKLFTKLLAHAANVGGGGNLGSYARLHSPEERTLGRRTVTRYPGLEGGRRQTDMGGGHTGRRKSPVSPQKSPIPLPQRTYVGITTQGANVKQLYWESNSCWAWGVQIVVKL